MREKEEEKVFREPTNKIAMMREVRDVFERHCGEVSTLLETRNFVLEVLARMREEVKKRAAYELLDSMTVQEIHTYLKLKDSSLVYSPPLPNKQLGKEQ
jgi:putative heme iron utilization protein